MKLYDKLVVSYLFACIIPLLIVSYTIYNLSVKSIEANSLEFASIYDSQIVTSIDNFVDDYDKITKSILVDNDIMSYLNNENNLSMTDKINNQLIIRKLLLRIETLKPDIKCSMLVTSKNDIYQYGNSSETVDEKKLLNQSWFKEMLKSDDKLIITPVHNKSYYANESQGVVFTVGRVILDSNGVYSGVLLIDLDPYKLINLNENFLNARNNYNIKLTVTTNKGEPIYDSDAASGRKLWSELLNYEHTITENRDKKDFIELSNKTTKGNLIVNTEIPRSKLLFNIGRISNATVLAVLLCVFFVIIISIVLSYQITKPMKVLQKNMKMLGNGQYSLITMNRSNDEIGSLIGSYNHMITKIKILIEDVYIAEIKQRHAKFLALQNQINPHMLYNTLESIRMKALVNGEDEVALMIKILSRMFRIALGKDSKQNLVCDELEYAQNYIQLQNIRFDNHFSLDIRLGEEIKNTKIIALIFQPIIENSITHGFQGYDQFLKIIIEGQILEDKDVVIRFIDNGTGMTEKRVEEINKLLSEAEYDKNKLNLNNEATSKGIGLENIAERIKLHYGDKYYLRILSGSSAGTSVEIKIPLE